MIRVCQDRLQTVPVRERGMALLVVLWIVVAAALVVSAFNAAVKSGVSFIGSEVQLSKSEALLDAGVEIAAARLIDEEEARRWVPDGRPYRIAFAGAELAISIRDASGYIDINKADGRLLMGLLSKFAGSEAKAARLRDRILASRGQPTGAKQEQVEQQQDADREPVRSPTAEAPVFMDVAQLRGLDGMTPQVYAAIAPFLTVYSRDGRVNPRAAPEEVLASIPALTQNDIAKLRSSADAPKEGDEDLSDIGQRAGAYLAEEAGPAYLVTVKALGADGRSGASALFVVAVGLDGQAPYRLIAKKAAGVGQASGAG